MGVRSPKLPRGFAAGKEEGDGVTAPRQSIPLAPLVYATRKHNFPENQMPKFRAEFTNFMQDLVVEQ